MGVFSFRRAHRVVVVPCRSIWFLRVVGVDVNAEQGEGLFSQFLDKRPLVGPAGSSGKSVFGPEIEPLVGPGGSSGKSARPRAEDTLHRRVGCGSPTCCTAGIGCRWFRWSSPAVSAGCRG